MEKIGILICSNSGIDYENVTYPYVVARSKLIIDGKEYEDYIDITADHFYQILVKNPNVPLSTAQVSTGELVEIYNNFKAQGYTDIVAISISSKLSGIYQNMVLASQMVEGINVHILDSKTVSYGQMYLVEYLASMIKEGKQSKEIMEKLTEKRDRIQIFVLVDTLKFLVKNGRLSVTSGALGTLLKIKPLLNFDSEGRLVAYEKIRTASKARARFMELAKGEIDKGVEAMFLAYTNNKEFVEEIRRELLEYKPELEIKMAPLTPVVGAHAGPGTCGFGFVKK
ncbi:MAG: DegV family protein [Acholeplasmataceae bacterium]|jgi:DegV family protein with EDD domain|nr:DegV family protein [Acholeplasmataceae bacterium]